MRYEPIIKLTWPMIHLVNILAKSRNNKEKKFGAMTYGEKRGGEEAHVMGLIAEVAVSHYFDVPLDVNEYEKGDKGTDFVMDNHKISVKATAYWDDPLLRVEKEHFLPDHFYFCTAVNAEKFLVKLVGWTDSDILKNAPVKIFVKNGPENFVLAPEDLNEFSKK